MAKDPVCSMEIDEAQALKFTTENETYYFCSENCLEKFVKERNLSVEKAKACLVRPPLRWYKNKTVIVTGILLSLSLTSYLMPVLEPFRKALVMYLDKIWWAILLGLFLGGIIDRFVPKRYISHYLAKPKKKTIVYAVLVGFFLSACSHGILALSIELHKKGASNPAVVAFLLASPWANFAITIMLIGFFGLKALYIIMCALIIAIITGFVFQFLEAKGLIEKNENTRKTQEDFSVFRDLKERFKLYEFTLKNMLQDVKGIFSGSVSLANMVLWWVLIGMGLASFAAAYVPQGVFREFMGPTVVGLGVTLVVATILEVCSEGTAPLAFEIYRQTLALGNAFVFLMAGVVTDYTEIGLLWHNVGKKVAIWLPIIAIPQVIILGMLANMIW